MKSEKIVFCGIQSGPEDEFGSLGSQKVDIYVVGKKAIFLWKISHPFLICYFSYS